MTTDIRKAEERVLEAAYKAQELLRRYYGEVDVEHMAEALRALDAARAAKPSEPTSDDVQKWDWFWKVEWEPRVREIALAVVNEMGAGVKVGEQILAIEKRLDGLELASSRQGAQMIDLFCRFDGAHASGLRERIEALERKAMPTAPASFGSRAWDEQSAKIGSSAPSPAQEIDWAAPTKPGAQTFVGDFSTARDLKPNIVKIEAPSPAQGETFHRLPSSVLDLARSIVKAGEPAPKPDGLGPVDSFHFALADELLAQHARAEGAEARGYERGVLTCIDHIPQWRHAAYKLRALLSPREGGKDALDSQAEKGQ